MANELILLVPEAPVPQADKPQTQQRKSAGGPLRLGTLGNSKANADPLLRLMVEAVLAEIPLKSVVALNKTNASVPGSDAILEQLAADCDLVISAMAD